MSQSILSLAALVCISLLTLSFKRGETQRALWESRSEIEAQAATLGAALLDAAEFAPPGGAPPGHVRLGRSLPLDHWSGRRDTIGVPFDGDTLRFLVRPTVDVVRKEGGEFVATHEPSPFRRLRLDIRGPLGTRAKMVRIYAQPSL